MVADLVAGLIVWLLVWLFGCCVAGLVGCWHNCPGPSGDDSRGCRAEREGGISRSRSKSRRHDGEEVTPCAYLQVGPGGIFGRESSAGTIVPGDQVFKLTNSQPTLPCLAQGTLVSLPGDQGTSLGTDNGTMINYSEGTMVQVGLLLLLLLLLAPATTSASHTYSCYSCY